MFWPFLIHKYSKIKKERDYEIYTKMKKDAVVDQYISEKPNEIQMKEQKGNQ